MLTPESLLPLIEQRVHVFITTSTLTFSGLVYIEDIHEERDRNVTIYITDGDSDIMFNMNDANITSEEKRITVQLKDTTIVFDWIFEFEELASE